MKRTHCVLCGGELKAFYEKADFPIRCCGEKADINWTMILGKCKWCDSIQQMNLLPPNILYGGVYLLDTSYSPEWSAHHDSFSDFICKYIPEKSRITEIGSSSQVLIKRLMEKKAYEYTVFDYSLETAQRLETITYIEGNCEEYAFPKDSILVMSHVFEHLYEPGKFIKNCYENQVGDVILSIPNMDDETQVSITREHTFTYKSSDIELLFKKHGYFCYQKQFYKSNHSIFLHFKLNNTTESFFTKTYTVPPESYLMGAGFYSQVIYGNITNPENIIGVVDNDRTKQGKLFYNTEFVIQPFSVLKTAKSIMVMKNKYWTEEVVKMIRDMNPDISIFWL